MSRTNNAALVAILLAYAATARGQTYAISTFAGGGFPTNVPGIGASLNSPGAVAVDSSGNVFFTESALSIVMRLDAKTGVLTVVAGNGMPGFSGDDGLAVNAQLNGPSGLAIDSSGNLYVSDTLNRRVRRVTNGVITTFAGGGTSKSDNVAATEEQFVEPLGIAVDPQGNLYICDGFGQSLRKVSAGIITTVAPSQEMPYAVTVDTSGNIYVIAGVNHNAQVSKISGGNATVLASLGPRGELPDPAAYLISPVAIAVDSSGKVYISDPGDSRIVTVSRGGVLTIVAGTGTSGYTGDGGPASTAELNNPQGIAIDSSGNLYMAAATGIRKVVGGSITTIAGGPNLSNGDGGPATAAQIVNPFGVAVDAGGNVFLSDAGAQRIRMVASTTGIITTVARLNDSPHGIAVDPADNVYAAKYALDQIDKISGGTVTTFAGAGGILGALGDDGPAVSAHLYFPNDVAVDSGGNVYIADGFHNRVRKVSGGTITTVAGNGTAGLAGDGGYAPSAELNGPTAVAVDSDGNLYIADTGNKRIREVTPAGSIGTLVAGLDSPGALAVDANGNVYMTDGTLIRRFSGGMLATVVGTGIFSNPQGLAIDSSGNLYVSDSQPGSGSGVIRRLTPQAGPRIAAGGIVPVYSSVPVIQAGSWVSIYGTNLAGGTSVWNNDFPTSLGGVTVTIDNKAASLWLVSPTQINLQAPDDLTTGLVSVVVTTPYGAATSSVMLAAEAPSLSLLGDERHVVGEILGFGGGYELAGPANTFSYATRPVRAGETLVLYGVGFGPTKPAVPAGQVFAGSAPAANSVHVTIGGIAANVLFAGITEAGLYQINVTVPAAASGDQPIAVETGGVRTPSGAVVTLQ